MKNEDKPRTVNVRTPHGTCKAICDLDGTVRIWDIIAEHWTLCHSLTEGQQRYVRSRVRRRGAPPPVGAT